MMVCWHRFLRTVACLGLVVVIGSGSFAGKVLAENEGVPDLNDAMREKVNATALRDINRVVELLQQAIDKGLDAEDAKFAEAMLSDSLMERATALVRVINARSILDPKIQQVRRLVISDLRRVLAYDNPPPLANFVLGRLMALPGGDPHEARRALTEFLKAPDLQDLQRAEAYILRARLQSDEAKALADFDEALRLAPDNANYRLVRVLFLRSRNKLEQALNEVGQVLDQTPDDANALILQGEVFRELGKLDEALESFDHATKLAPQAPSPFQNRGEIYRDREDFDQAIDQFSKVLELQPGGLLSHVHRAEAYLLSGRLEEALADVEVVLEKQPLISAHQIRARVLAKMDRLQEAIEEIKQVSEAMPEQTDLKMQLALYYAVNKQPSKAIAIYDKILESDEKNFMAWHSRGDAYLNAGQHPEAVADLQRALALEPNDSAVLNNLAWVLATSPEDQVRDATKAIELATKACEQTDYAKPHILSTLAAAFAEAGQFEKAIKWSQKAVDMEDPEHQEQLAKELASYQKGQPWREKQLVPQRDANPEKEPVSTQAAEAGGE